MEEMDEMAELNKITPVVRHRETAYGGDVRFLITDGVTGMTYYDTVVKIPYSFFRIAMQNLLIQAHADGYADGDLGGYSRGLEDGKRLQAERTAADAETEDPEPEYK